jgi:hypothetical protein
MGIRSTHEEVSHPVYRYAMLVFILIMFGLCIRWQVMLPPTYDGDRYVLYVLLFAMLLNHLACAFKWPRRINVALWVFTWSWLIFTIFYCLFLPHFLFPSYPSPF